MILQDVRPNIMSLIDERKHLKDSDSIESQKKEILEHLQSGGSTNAKHAEKVFGCMNLSARINEIRDIYGYEAIRTELIRFVSYRNNKKTYKVYAEYTWRNNGIIRKG